MWSLFLNKLVLLAIAFAAVSAYAGFEHWRAGKWEKDYYTLEADVKAKGEVAKAQAKAKEAEDKQKKEAADAENAKTVIALTADNERLRQQRATRSYLPPASPGAGKPETACLNRADAERAIRDFVEGAGRLAEEGDRAIVDLNTDKRWAQH